MAQNHLHGVVVRSELIRERKRVDTSAENRRFACDLLRNCGQSSSGLSLGALPSIVLLLGQFVPINPWQIVVRSEALRFLAYKRAYLMVSSRGIDHPFAVRLAMRSVRSSILCSLNPRRDHLQAAIVTPHESLAHASIPPTAVRTLGTSTFHVDRPVPPLRRTLVASEFRP